ncbi:MAG: Homogentisate 1,2-dioxygenase [Candidatus Scalindua rubra]|uniref:Homogentisate 1,2-dioxygenase n=1 Tax=Candidatus Scalindua rubra TaxID=1872076 RepID=A0A1E3X4D6_9BACT|nr:MAG: Homogentisate 1,2-dioxygenase [Candidatus Scalindua rubra]
MPFYHKLGQIPSKRHITFYKKDGKSLYREELFGTRGFSGIYSNKYHIYMPSGAKSVREVTGPHSEKWPESPLQWYLFHTDRKQMPGDYVRSRMLYLFNAHCAISTSTPDQKCDIFYKNAYAHELIFVHRGKGSLYSEFGKLTFSHGDYLIMPKGVMYRMDFDEYENNKLFILESDTPFDIPNHFRNEYGQLLEDAPYCERDFRPPEFVEPIDQLGEYNVWIKAGERMFEHVWDHHPFDVVGWDGFEYPFAFDIKEYAPKVGKIHLPPPVHLVFTTIHFVVCNFVPRLFDFHPQAIPAPYFHSNVDSDEVIYYVEGRFMSRKGIEEGSITLHPTGIPHGPQPGKTEESIGAKKTDEYAVMVDTFSPLSLTKNVQETMDDRYSQSWLDASK